MAHELFIYPRILELVWFKIPEGARYCEWRNYPLDTMQDVVFCDSVLEEKGSEYSSEIAPEIGIIGMSFYRDQILYSYRDREYPRIQDAKPEKERPFTKRILTPKDKKIIVPRAGFSYEFEQVGEEKILVSFYLPEQHNFWRRPMQKGIREMEIDCHRANGKLSVYARCFHNGFNGEKKKTYDAKGNLINR